jgi:hypothetical protein
VAGVGEKREREKEENKKQEEKTKEKMVSIIEDIKNIFKKKSKQSFSDDKLKRWLIYGLRKGYNVYELRDNLVRRGMMEDGDRLVEISKGGASPDKK